MSAYLDIFSRKWYDQNHLEAFSKGIFGAESVLDEYVKMKITDTWDEEAWENDLHRLPLSMG